MQKDQHAPHAVIIGTGFGGLAAAVRLLAKGYRVSLVERLDQAGGRAYVHRDQGFTFDAGPTIITDPFAFEELWALTGHHMADDVELLPVAPFYRLNWPDGTNFDFVHCLINVKGIGIIHRPSIQHFGMQNWC